MSIQSVVVCSDDLISRRAAIDALKEIFNPSITKFVQAKLVIENLPSVQPERVWHSCKTPPKHHKDVLVRGTEAIGNVTTYKVMQWDVDAWRPTDYAPSIIWEEWSEI